MRWIALQWPPPEPGTPAFPAEALGWWALQFTPRVAWQDEALLLEVSACERLWGGGRALMCQLAATNPAEEPLLLAQGATSLIALARLRLRARGERPPAGVPAALPLDTLSAAFEHLDLLARLGCRTWGDVAALPRSGLTRRFGKELREALDAAWGLHPESHAWLTLPDVFEQKLELPMLAESAPELMWAANRLLGALQVWLRARQRGVCAFELQWTLDLKRFNGADLPPHQQITVRTAEPTQDMAHLRRLMGERLALARLAAPASWLQLRSLQTLAWAGASTSFLPEDNRKGDRLHELIERLSVRLGPQQVLVPTSHADHRPECRQTWAPALHQGKGKGKGKDYGGSQGRGRVDVQAVAPPQSHALYPAWLLPAPLLLEMDGERPCYRGQLRRLVGPQRVEAGWWEHGRPAVRDYYIAESPEAGLVWIFRERPSARFSAGEVRWFLQGLYA